MIKACDHCQKTIKFTLSQIHYYKINVGNTTVKEPYIICPYCGGHSLVAKTYR